MTRTKYTPARLAIGCCALSFLLVVTVDLGADRAVKEQTSRGAIDAVDALTEPASQPNPRELQREGDSAWGKCATATQHLVCLTKKNTRLDPERVRVRIIRLETTGSLLCVATRAESMTGLLDVYFDHQVHHASIPVPREDHVASFSEPPLPGDNWDWCNAASS